MAWNPIQPADHLQSMLVQMQWDFAFIFVSIAQTAHREKRLDDYEFSKRRARQILGEIRRQAGSLSELAQTQVSKQIVHLQAAVDLLESINDNARAAEQSVFAS